MEDATPPGLLRPVPRRSFQLHSDSSSNDSHPPTPNSSADMTVEGDSREELGRTRSVLNLTKSTLFGIYEPTADDSGSQPQTPWGTGAETPQHRGSLDGYPSPRGGTFKEADLDRRLLRESLRTSGINGHALASPTNISHHAPRSPAATVAKTFLRAIVLYGCGMAYGALIAHLHDNKRVSPVRVEGLNRESWRYQAFWGAASVLLGLLMPWVDTKWIEEEENKTIRNSSSVLNAVEWNDVVRSVGAFIGIAFAIRKTPWSSPLQLSVTLSLVNPFLWYLLDRTSAGLTLSMASGIFGILAVLLLNPSWVPAPSHSLLVQSNATVYQIGMPETLENVLSHERVGLAIWIGSVFFCSCICFSNIGRLLVSGRRVR